MPTSSQALILIKTDSDRLSKIYKTRVTSDFPPLLLPKINLDEAKLSSSVGSVFMKKYRDSIVHLVNGNSSTPIGGCRGVLTFDPEAKTFKWQLLRDPTEPLLKRPCRLSRTTSNEHELTDLDDSSALQEMEEDAVHVRYRRLLDLGFRTSTDRDLVSPLMETCERTSPLRWSPLRLSPQRSSPQMMSPERMSPQRPSTAATPWHSSKSSDRRDEEYITTSTPSLSSLHTKPQTLKDHENTEISRRRHSDITVSLEKDVEPVISQIPDQEELLLYEKAKEIAKAKNPRLPVIRLRRELPPPAPDTLCICLKWKRPYSHEEIKSIIEEQIYATIGTLLFDPVYVHLGAENSDGACLWVFTIENESLRMQLLSEGLTFEGERVRVRRYDDVMRDEHQAYRLLRQVKEEQERRNITPVVRPLPKRSLRVYRSCPTKRSSRSLKL